MNLEELLNECQQHHLILRTNRRGQATMWAPNVKVSRQLRSLIRQFNDEIVQSIERSAASVCPSPRLHAAYFGDTCFICQRLDAAIAPQRRQRAA
jgi:hypothetical protein